AFVVAAQEILVGVALATALQLLLHVFVMAGQMMAMQMGLGFASMVDPANGISVTVMSQLYLMIVTLLFLAVDGHLAMIQVLSESFSALPVAAAPSASLPWLLVSQGSWMFVAAALLALPAITALLVVNISLGIVTRAAPQMNIFAVGFPMMLVFGVVVVWLTLGAVGPHFMRLTEDTLLLMRALV
ncbi:MAG: flagellar biosynthetic protein FliR, partial [Spongiibacteraceae bacterium]|nr:flagellar biosynthetic protein FliR [Spongiibacteraceae bacterium]